MKTSTWAILSSFLLLLAFGGGATGATLLLLVLFVVRWAWNVRHGERARALELARLRGQLEAGGPPPGMAVWPSRLEEEIPRLTAEVAPEIDANVWAFLVIGVSIVMLLMALDGRVSRLEGAVLMLGVMDVEGVTATGLAHEVPTGSEFERWSRLLTDRHPYLNTFVRSASCGLFRIDIIRYFHVTRFQEVRQWVPRSRA